jgi:hypothetical protein
MVSSGSLRAICRENVAVRDALNEDLMMADPDTFAVSAWWLHRRGPSCAGRSRHRNLHGRKDHGAADQLPAEQCRFPAEDHHQAKLGPPVEDRCRQPADRGVEERSWVCRIVSDVQSAQNKAAEDAKKPAAADTAPARRHEVTGVQRSEARYCSMTALSP